MEDTRNWYQKKRWIFSAIAGRVLVFSGGEESSSTTNYVAPPVDSTANRVRTITPSADDRPTVSKPVSAPKSISEPTAQSCHPNYSGCLKPNASDYDCAGGSGNGPYYTGVVRVIGADVFDVDRGRV